MNISSIFSKWTRMSLVFRILIGLILGTSFGIAVPQWTAIGIFGTVFVSALKAIAPVLVAVLVAASIAKASDVFFTATAEYHEASHKKTAARDKRKNRCFHQHPKKQ